MVLISRIQIVLCAIAVATSSGAMLREQPKSKPAVKDTATKAAAPVKAAAPKDAKAAAPQEVKAKKPLTEEEQLQALNKGLTTIHNLRSMFSKQLSDGPMAGAEKFANGALSEELSKKDSQIWSTIENMIGTTQQAMTSIKGKSKAEKEKAMASLEADLDKKATVLNNVNQDVSKKQQQQDEEYLLGLLIMHRNDWSMDKKLNATETFMKNSPLLQNFYKHHDDKKPLETQLAALMDAKPKDGAKVEEKVVKAPVAETKNKRVAKAATGAARALFIQLASTFRNRDCPYCAAQCVDKCHQAGKPYVQCLTDCADAGK